MYYLIATTCTIIALVLQYYRKDLAVLAALFTSAHYLPPPHQWFLDIVAAALTPSSLPIGNCWVQPAPAPPRLSVASWCRRWFLTPNAPALPPSALFPLSSTEQESHQSLCQTSILSPLTLLLVGSPPRHLCPCALILIIEPPRISALSLCLLNTLIPSLDGIPSINYRSWFYLPTLLLLCLYCRSDWALMPADLFLLIELRSPFTIMPSSPHFVFDSSLTSAMITPSYPITFHRSYEEDFT